MKNKTAKIFYLFLAFILTSCFQEVVDIDLSEIPRQLVIEGKITNEYTRHTVRIHRASANDDPYEFQKITDAEVSITDNEGTEFVLEETESGIYKTQPFYGIPGRHYRLHVKYGGLEFEAESYMPQPIELDSIKLDQVNNYNTYKLKCYFQDVPDVEEKALFKSISMNNNIVREELLYNGSYRDGNYIELDDFKWQYSRGNQVLVEVYSLNETSYNIYNQIQQRKDLSSDGTDIDIGNLFELTSFNISNINNHAIGLFSAESVTKQTFTIN